MINKKQTQTERIRRVLFDMGGSTDSFSGGTPYRLALTARINEQNVYRQNSPNIILPCFRKYDNGKLIEENPLNSTSIDGYVAVITGDIWPEKANEIEQVFTTAKERGLPSILFTTNKRKTLKDRAEQLRPEIEKITKYLSELEELYGLHKENNKYHQRSIQIGRALGLIGNSQTDFVFPRHIKELLGKKQRIESYCSSVSEMMKRRTSEPNVKIITYTDKEGYVPESLIPDMVVAAITPWLRQL